MNIHVSGVSVLKAVRTNKMYFVILLIIISNETNSYLNDCLVLAIDKFGSKVDNLSGNASFDMLCGRIGK